METQEDLRHTNKLEMYDRTIQEHRTNEVIGKTGVEEVNEKVFYLPQRPAIRESVETI